MPAESRLNILEAIEASPGVTKSELCRDLGLGWGTIDYHVRQLERGGALRVLRQGSTTCLFPAHVPSVEAEALAVLHRPVSQRILERLRLGPSGVRELSRDLDLSRQTIRRHLQDLHHVGAMPDPPGGQPPIQSR